MKKFKIVTLGCRTNQYESAAYTDQLKKLGYLPCSEEEQADICILNTCTVTHSADVRSKASLRQLLHQNPKATLFVTGCMVEEAKKQIQEERVVFVPNKEKENLIEWVFPEEQNLPEFSIEQFEAHTRAFVKVQDGCNSFCSYCIIPYVRGRSRCRCSKEVVDEVKNLINQGYKEIVLTGINIGDYEDGEKNLADLVREVDQIKGLHRLRLSSIDADEVDGNLVEAILQGKTTCPSMHIVLQSGSNVILKKMNRKYTRQIFLDTVEKLRKENSDFTVTTDVIVGFPGETEEDFCDTLEVIEKVRFAKVHMFPFSPRKRTKAATFLNQIDPKTIQIRKRKLLQKAEEVAFLLREKFVGRKVPVLLEERVSKDYIAGHTPNFLRVKVASSSLEKNQIVEVLLQENREDGFLGVTL